MMDEHYRDGLNFRAYGTNDNPSECEHGYAGWCPLCTPPAKTAETAGLPVSPSSQEHSGALVVPIIGLALAVGSAVGVAVWIL